MVEVLNPIMLKMKKNKSIEISKISLTGGGFTLVEILVSITVFLLAISVAMQLFFYSTRAYRRLLAHSELMGESSYVLEHISRGLRMAKKSQTGGTCLAALGQNFESNAAGEIKFQNSNIIATNPTDEIDCVEYYLGHPANYPSGTIALMERRSKPLPNPNSIDLPLTSPQTTILEFSIIGSGWNQTDNLQPRVTLYIKMQGKENVAAENQITISMRDIDINTVD